MKRIKLLLFTVILLYLSGSSHAADINAASCSQADVQAAVDSAQDGDRVLVPAGNCTWTTRVTIQDKRITLQGAGISQTTITDDTDPDVILEFLIDTNKQDMTRITGFTFDRNGTNKISGSGTINIAANSDNLSAFRVDNVEFLELGGTAITVFMRGWEISGVIDNVTFQMNLGAGAKSIKVLGTRAQEHQPFSRPVELGSEKFIFIEDCTFNFPDKEDGALDAFSGARYVFRYNTVNNTESGHHGADSGGFRGIHSFEYYNNVFDRQTPGNIRSLLFRSGSGVVFNNTFSGNYEQPQVQNFRSRPQDFAPWGACDGTSIWDGNQPGMNGYPCLDQIGHVFTDQSGGVSTFEGIYYWNNTLNGVPTATHVPFNEPQGVHDHLVEGRDFFNNTKRPNYTPFTYPHPLRGEGNGDPRPDPPTNLGVVVQ